MSMGANLVQVVVQTRFSYLGQSGWRSDASRRAEELFDPERLNRRFALFENITLPSLANQTDGDFRLIVLSAAKMPESYRQRLVALVSDQLGDTRATIKFAWPGYASKKMAIAIKSALPLQDAIIEVVLDDDDALATTYIENLRVGVALQAQPLLAQHQYAFVTFPRGLSLFANDGKIAFQNRMVPFTNLGLALVAAPSLGKNIFAVSHKRIGERHPHVVIDSGEPTYVRSVHGDNDSRGIIGTGVIEDAEVKTILTKHFPHLIGLNPKLLMRD